MSEHADDNIFVEERKQLIVNYVNQNVKATVAELCEQFSVSSATIRNDLRELDSRGLIRRTHGGAISISVVNFEPTASESRVTRIEEKKAIARAAVNYIKEGNCIALDAGTTNYELAKLLTGYQNLTVITYDLNIAEFLDNNSHVNLIMAGGMVRRQFHYTCGDRAVATIQDLNVDLAFIAANGVSADRGMSTPEMETAKIKQVMMKNAQRVILMADSSKLNKVSFVQFADWRDISVFITDQQADSGMLQTIAKKEVEIELA